MACCMPCHRKLLKRTANQRSTIIPKTAALNSAATLFSGRRAAVGKLAACFIVGNDPSKSGCVHSLFKPPKCGFGTADLNSSVYIIALGTAGK
ncbi:hypothetical protein HPP92_011044 [Vanilla planifolia]|uniref:Uncharacterized protein n=1 Tax=Vanilla planifolia TaxID=51239 RepID=A0A835R048_VANPL|nr:hypothetical protein HPP92_011044 [Vanilla planifolia]